MKIKRIFADEYLLKTGNITTIDLRTPAEIRSEYLEGCIGIPVQNINKENLQQALVKNHQSSKEIHLLCQSGRRAEIAVERLAGLSGYDLVIIEGGITSLKAAGAQIIESTRKTISLERQVRIAAGALTVAGVALGLTVNPGFFGISAFVGAGLMFAGITDTCGMAMMLAQMPWNKTAKA